MGKKVVQLRVPWARDRRSVLRGYGVVGPSILLLAVLLGLGAPSRAADDRFLELGGVRNTRDLGGLETADGRSVRSGSLVRSGEIDHIDQAGRDLLDEMDVETIIDLRTAKEAAHPAVWPEGTGPRRIAVPLMENQTGEIAEMRRRIDSGTATAEWMDQEFRDSFGTIPIEYPDQLRQVFDVLLENPEGEAVLFHCSGGKDRTGVTTVLVLTALGVTRSEIEKDFLASNVGNDADAASIRKAAKINAARGTEMKPEAVWPALGVRPSYLAHFYETIEGRYGSVDAYLEQALGLTEEDLLVLRARYLTEPAVDPEGR